jgi:hypothetical protein
MIIAVNTNVLRGKWKAMDIEEVFSRIAQLHPEHTFIFSFVSQFGMLRPKPVIKPQARLLILWNICTTGRFPLY